MNLVCFCPVFSEVLYEDEAFKQRQLSALLASKVYTLVQMLYCLVEMLILATSCYRNLLCFFAVLVLCYERCLVTLHGCCFVFLGVLPSWSL